MFCLSQDDGRVGEATGQIINFQRQIRIGLFVMSLFHKQAPMGFYALMGGVYQIVIIMYSKFCFNLSLKGLELWWTWTNQSNAVKFWSLRSIWFYKVQVLTCFYQDHNNGRCCIHGLLGEAPVKAWVTIAWWYYIFPCKMFMRYIWTDF